MAWQKQFRDEDVLDRAMAAFWSRGYEATSINDLVEAMGINRGSLYATFTDKRTLFIHALKRYDALHRQRFLNEVAARHGPREAILAAFAAVVEQAQGGRNRKGCLLVNTALELSPHDPEVAQLVNRSLAQVERFFHDRLLEARGQDALPAETPKRSGAKPERSDTDTDAKALLALSLGLRVLPRSGPDAATMRAVLKQAQALVG